MRKAALISLALAGAVILGFILQQQAGLSREAQWQRYHCLDGSRWKGHLQEGPARLDFKDGTLLLEHLDKKSLKVLRTESCRYECGRDGNIYYGCANQREFKRAVETLTGIGPTQGALFERLTE